MANSALRILRLASPSSCARQTRLVLGLIALGCSTLAPLSVSAAIRSYPQLALNDGRLFVGVTVVSYTANGILVRHADGATVLRTKLLPASVIDDLRLSRLETAETPAFDATLADKVAVDDSARPVISGQELPATRQPESVGVSTEPDSSAIAHAPAVAVPAPTTEPATPPPAGEGNIPEFFAAQTAIASVTDAARGDVSGRVVVALPSGKKQLLEGVEIRAYPAALLETYLREADARCQHEAKKFLANAAIATAEGRTGDAERLTLHAERAATQQLNLIPAAPFVTHTDAYGSFTIRHTLADARLVAIGDMTVAQEQFHYEWVGIASDKEVILTEANATTAANSARPTPRFAAR